MPYGFNRVVQNHPWAGEPHYFTYLLPHILAVAVSRTFLAGGLLLSILASRKSLVGVFLKLSASTAEGFITFFLATVESDH